MAIEAQRGCGYRKVGGLYLVGGSIMAPCGLLPWPLLACPCCSGGWKQARSWAWVEPARLFKFPKLDYQPEDDQPDFSKLRPDCVAGRCHETGSGVGCPLNDPARLGERAGLLWIGESFYPTPADFLKEGQEQGISRRITTVPKGFEAGKTWVLLAHPKAGLKIPGDSTAVSLRNKREVWPEPCPGIFSAFRPRAIEQIVTQSEFEDEEAMEKLEKRGITPVPVPDDDQDHNPDAKPIPASSKPEEWPAPRTDPWAGP